MMVMKNGDKKKAVSDLSPALITSNYHYFSSPVFITSLIAIPRPRVK